MGQKQARIKELGPTGWLWRWRLINSPVIQEQFRQERKMLGLPAVPQGQVLSSPRKVEKAKEAEAEAPAPVKQQPVRDELGNLTL